MGSGVGSFPVLLYLSFIFSHSALAPEGLLRNINSVDARPEILMWPDLHPMKGSIRFTFGMMTVVETMSESSGTDDLIHSPGMKRYRDLHFFFGYFRDGLAYNLRK
jgi:hypothetical protein